MIQVLERRRHFSVSISEDFPGFYQITGDGSANTISLSVSMSEESFTFDEVTYYEVSYIVVSSGGGDDAITLTSVDGSGTIGAAVDAGEGADSVSVNFDAVVAGGDGNDSLYLSDSYRGEAHGDGGNDQIYISGACVDAVIEGGDGNDLIDCSANASGVTVHGGNGDDTIYGSAYADEIYGDAGTNLLIGNAGDDVFNSRDGSGDSIIGGDGSDMLYANGLESGVSGVEYTFYG